jgi:hypothetical protein
MLNGAVNGTDPIPPTRCPAISNGGGPSAANAGVAVVGVSSRSTCSNAAAIAANTSWRRRSARIMSSGAMRSIICNPARGTGVTSSSRPRESSRWSAAIVSAERMPHARPGFGTRTSTSTSSMPASSHSASAASCDSFSTSGSHTA